MFLCVCVHVYKVVRLGHPARLLSVVQEHSLDALLSNSEGTAIVRDVRKDIDETLVRKIQHVVPENIHNFTMKFIGNSNFTQEDITRSHHKFNPGNNMSVPNCDHMIRILNG